MCLYQTLQNGSAGWLWTNKSFVKCGPSPQGHMIQCQPGFPVYHDEWHMALRSCHRFDSWSLLVMYMWGPWCQKQVSQAGISNCIPQNTVGCNYLSLPKVLNRYLRQGLVIASHRILWDAITYRCRRYLLLTQKSSYLSVNWIVIMLQQWIWRSILDSACPSVPLSIHPCDLLIFCLLSVLPSVYPSVPHAISISVASIAYFMDYIHIWHKYNP